MHSYQQGRRGIRPASSRPRPLPPGMGTALCKFYPSGACTRGESCLYRHTTSPDKNSSAGKSFAARRYVQHPHTADAAPSTPSPSRRGLTAPPIPSSGRGGAHAPAQLTPIKSRTYCARNDGGHGQTVSDAGTTTFTDGGAVKNASAPKSYKKSPAPKSGTNSVMSSSRRSTSPLKKYRRGFPKAFNAGGGQPNNMSSAASGPSKKEMNGKIGPDNTQPHSPDEDSTAAVATQDGFPADTDTDTDTNKNVGDEMPMTRSDDQEGVTVGGDPSADGHNVTNHDYVRDRAPQTPTFNNSKPSSKGTRDDDEDEAEEQSAHEQNEILAQYWHENIRMSVFTHEDVTKILKRCGKTQGVTVSRAGKGLHSPKGGKAHEQPTQGDDDDAARSNSKDGTTSMDVCNSASNQGTGERADREDTDKCGGVTHAPGGTDTAEWEDATDDQDTNINKAFVVTTTYDVDTAERKCCRCFCPPEVTWAKIDLPCPNFDNCPLSFCPYEHKSKETFEKRMAERGKSINDLVTGFHDETLHIPDDYNEEKGKIPSRVEIDIVDILSKMTSPSCVPTHSPSSDDTIILCQPIPSADSSAEGGTCTTSSTTTSDAEGDEGNVGEAAADLYCYDDGGAFHFLVPPSIPNDPRTQEELHWEDAEAYSRESAHGPIQQVASGVHVGAKEAQDEIELPEGKGLGSTANICDSAAGSDDSSVNAGVNVDSPYSKKKKNGRTSTVHQGQRKGGRKPWRGNKTKKYSDIVPNKRSPFKQPQQSKTGTKLNPSATEFVPSTPTSTTKTTVVHVDVEGGKKAICTPAGKSDASSTPTYHSSSEPRSGKYGKASCSRSEIKDDQKSLDSTTAISKDSISSSIILDGSNVKGSKVPPQTDARAISTNDCPTEPLVSNVKTYPAASNDMEKDTDPTPTADTADTTGASEIPALSIPQDKHVPESRERSGAFDLSRNVSPPAPSWSSPTRFQGTDKEVMEAIRKSDHELNFLNAMKSKPKKPDHPECGLPTNTAFTATPANIHDKKKKKRRSGNAPSSKPGVSQGKLSNSNPSKIIDGKKNAADTLPAVPQEPRIKSQSKPKPKSKSKSKSNSIKEATTVTNPDASVSRDSLSGPSNSSSSNSSTDAIPAEASVDKCVKRMEEMEFSSSVISQTEAEFRSKKPGSWTEEALFSLACHLSRQEELNKAALEEHSLKEENETSSVHPASRAKSERDVKETKGIAPEDDQTKQTANEKKGAAKKNKAAEKNRRKRKNKAKRAFESKANITSSQPAATPSEGGEATKTKTCRGIPKNEVEKPMEQNSKAPASPQLLKRTSSGDRIDRSITEPSLEAKNRFRFWSAEQFHRDLYTKNLFKLISYEYSRHQHCENFEDTSSNDVLVEAFMKECTRVYENLYKYRTGAKSTVMVADDHPTLSGRTGRIVDSDISKHEFEVEFHRSKNEKIANKNTKTVAMSAINDDDHYDVFDVDTGGTDPSTAFTRLKISAYDLAVPDVAGGRGKGRSNKNAKNNKAAAQSLRPAECTLVIDEDETNNIHGFSMVVRASTLNELAGLKDSELLAQRLGEIMKERDEQEEAAKVLEEQNKQAKIREAEEQEKQEIAKRFRKYEKEINGRKKKARRILSSGKSKFVKALKTKPETPEKLYDGSDSLQASVHNGFVDLLATLHERDDKEAQELIEAIRGSELSPSTIEFNESDEGTKVCLLFEDEDHKIPLCIVNHSGENHVPMKDEFDTVVNSMFEQDQFDELCCETGLQRREALIFVHALINIEKDSGIEFEIPHRVIRRLIERDLLDSDFVREVFSGDERVGSDKARLFLRAVSQRLSMRLSFNLSDLVRGLVQIIEEFDQEQVSDSDQDSDGEHLFDRDLFEKFCKVTGLNEQDALLIATQYLQYRQGNAVAPELNQLPEYYLTKLVRSGFLDHNLVSKLFKGDGGFMTGEMFLTLVSQALESRMAFSLSDLFLADPESSGRDKVVSDEGILIEEIPSDGDETAVTVKDGNNSESGSESESKTSMREYEC